MLPAFSPDALYRNTSLAVAAVSMCGLFAIPAPSMQDPKSEAILTYAQALLLVIDECWSSPLIRTDDTGQICLDQNPLAMWPSASVSALRCAGTNSSPGRQREHCAPDATMERMDCARQHLPTSRIDRCRIRRAMRHLGGNGVLSPVGCEDGPWLMGPFRKWHGGFGICSVDVNEHIGCR